MKLGTNVLVKVNYNRPGYVVAIKGDYIEVQMPAWKEYVARRDIYYINDLIIVK